MYADDWRENIRIIKGYCKWWCYNNGEDYPDDSTETPNLNNRILLSMCYDMGIMWEIEPIYKQYLRNLIEELGRRINRPKSLLRENSAFRCWYEGGCILPEKEIIPTKIQEPKIDNFEELLTVLIRKILIGEGVINDNTRVS